MSRPRPTPADREALRRLSIRLTADVISTVIARSRASAAPIPARRERRKAARKKEAPE